jgi:hypothetical protein
MNKVIPDGRLGLSSHCIPFWNLINHLRLPDFKQWFKRAAMQILF